MELTPVLVRYINNPQVEGKIAGCPVVLADEPYPLSTASLVRTKLVLTTCGSAYPLLTPLLRPTP